MTGQKLSTLEFIERLRLIRPASTDVLTLFRVDFDPELFLSEVGGTDFRIVETNDGPISVVEEYDDPLDFSHQTGAFDLHTDGLYLETVPDYVILFCIDPGDSKTPTVFADTRDRASRLASQESQRVLDQLEIVNINKVGWTFWRPLSQRHPRSDEMILNLGTRAFVRPRLEPDQIAKSPSMRQVVNMMSELYGLLDSSVVRRHNWNAGDLILFDNYSFVHGRIANAVDRRRKLLRIWLSFK